MATRVRLLWVGDPPPGELLEQCKERDLVLAPVTIAEARAQWPSSRTVVFSRPNTKLLEAMRSQLIAEAVMHGLLVFVVAPVADVPGLNEVIRALPFGGRVRVWALQGVRRIAEQSARWDPGPDPAAVDLKGCTQCSEEDLILLRRAFNDCSEVEFRRLDGGGPTVFQAFAKLRNSAAGPYPLPFFVKLDGYARSQRELENYKLCTTHFIPFYARPNLDHGRCLAGADRGLIVGNFVENSDSLAELVTRGTAQMAINSLFEDALRGWRTQAYLSQSGVVEASLAPRGAIRTWDERQRRRARDYAAEAREFGATLSAAEIAGLLDSLPALRHRQALCHGDLHGENVRVRAGQAILIDFLAVAPGPLVMDPAALETSLVLKFAADPDVWRALVSDLYTLENLQSLPQPRAPTAPVNELWNSVRQVRRFGLADQLSANEYATAVAIQLLRHGLRKRDASEQPLRRPMLVLLAETLALCLANSGKHMSRPAA
jgi:hypothetical protein